MSASGKGLQEFIAEATEILESLGRDVVLLDDHRGEEPDPELVNRIFRGAHSIKGLSAMFGQSRIAALAHQTEDLLDRLRLGKLSLTDEVLDSLIESLDVFQGLLVEASRDENAEAWSPRAKALLERMERLAEPTPAQTDDPLDLVDLDPQIRAVFTEYEEHRLRENVRKGMRLWKVRAAFELSDFDKGLADLNARLKPIGEVISTLPSAEPGGGTGIAFDLIFGTKLRAEDLRTGLSGTPATLAEIPLKASGAAAAPSAPKPTKPSKRTKKKPAVPPGEGRGEGAGAVEKVDIVNSASPSPAPLTLPAPSSTQPIVREESSLRSLTQTVRVDIRRLDALMNTVGELLLIKGNLQRLADQAAAPGVHVLPKIWAQELTRESRQLERKLDDLQGGLLDARMVPLGQVFDKLSRLVRRIAREAGKEIDFLVDGGEVELDKLIVEELSDPLMHIIRNAIDHGVESPDARERSQKPRRGRVRLSAAQKGNQVVIDLSDDGAGIDFARVREVALQRGLISSREAEEMDAREISNLIFEPGFSTARSVSALSGRGVGLDVVKTNIANLSGLIDVESTPGQGTTFRITLPVTLAIIRALVVTVSGRLYAVPLNSVLEITSVTPAELKTVERREVISLRGQTLPFTRLARLFGHPERPLSRFFVVVVGLAQERMGIAVDELVGQQDIVIKPLGGRLRNVRGVAGATDLGNRRTVLVLDVGELMDEVINPDRHADVI